MLIGTIFNAVAPNSFPSQYLFPPAPTFEPQRDMPDLSDKVTARWESCRFYWYNLGN